MLLTPSRKQLLVQHSSCDGSMSEYSALLKVQPSDRVTMRQLESGSSNVARLTALGTVALSTTLLACLWSTNLNTQLPVGNFASNTQHGTATRPRLGAGIRLPTSTSRNVKTSVRIQTSQNGWKMPAPLYTEVRSPTAPLAVAGAVVGAVMGALGTLAVAKLHSWRRPTSSGPLAPLALDGQTTNPKGVARPLALSDLVSSPVRQRSLALHANRPDAGPDTALYSILSPKSPVGELLYTTEEIHPADFYKTVDDELTSLCKCQEEEEERDGLQLNETEAVLYRRITEFKRKDRQQALEDVLYFGVIHQFRVLPFQVARYETNSHRCRCARKQCNAQDCFMLFAIQERVRRSTRISGLGFVGDDEVGMDQGVFGERGGGRVAKIWEVVNWERAKARLCVFHSTLVFPASSPTNSNMAQRSALRERTWVLWTSSN